mmetsp:Transcript_49148/g.111466  ORF Transcript_49148/g.111466 Transcript_49148/m.111466 type:complete len:325 (+) Transcript_49148:1157-2131(+)
MRRLRQSGSPSPCCASSSTDFHTPSGLPRWIAILFCGPFISARPLPRTTRQLRSTLGLRGNFTGGLTRLSRGGPASFIECATRLANSTSLAAPPSEPPCVTSPGACGSQCRTRTRRSRFAFASHAGSARPTHSRPRTWDRPPTTPTTARPWRPTTTFLCRKWRIWRSGSWCRPAPCPLSTTGATWGRPARARATSGNRPPSDSQRRGQRKRRLWGPRASAEWATSPTGPGPTTLRNLGRFFKASAARLGDSGKTGVSSAANRAAGAEWGGPSALRWAAAIIPGSGTRPAFWRREAWRRRRDTTSGWFGALATLAPNRMAAARPQ